MDWSYGTSAFAPAEETPQVAVPYAPAAPAVESDVLGAEGVAVAVAQTGSGGVGVDEEAVQRDAADFADACRRAIQNGKTIDEVMAMGASLSEAAKQEIYAQACTQQGTSAEEVARKAEEQRQQDMAAIQQGVFGVATLGLAANATQQNMCLAPGVTGGEHVSLAQLFELRPLDTPGMEQERERGLFT